MSALQDNTYVIDETGRGNDLVALGGTAATFNFLERGPISGERTGVELDGVAAYFVARTPQPFDFASGTAFTLECWARPVFEAPADSGAITYRKILGRFGSVGYELYTANLDADGGTYVAAQYDAPNGQSVVLPGSAAKQKYVHYAFVYSPEDGGPGSVALYLDGVLVKSDAVPALLTSQEGLAFAVGGTAQGGGLFFGAVAEVAVYRKALTIERIAVHRGLASL